tara:strand:- start:6 stop:170 length:165 start_codon:yes stop_codon:yes gene_type:complete
MNYKLVNNSFTGNLQNIKRTDVTPPIFIPINETNTDYKKYLEWVAEGNTAEAAD